MIRAAVIAAALALSGHAGAQAPRTGQTGTGASGTVRAVAERTAPTSDSPDPVDRLRSVRAPAFDQPITLRALFETLAKRAGVPVHGLWQGKVPGAGLDPDATITLDGPPGSCGDALDRAMDQVSTSSEPALWQATRNGVEAGPRSTLWRASALQVRTYDVSDLMLRAPAFRSAGVPQPAGGNASGGTGSAGEGDPQDPTVRARRDGTREELVLLIQRCVVPEAWQANGGPCTIVPHDNLMVVRAPDFVHRLIEQPVPARRAPRAVGSGEKKAP